MIEIIKEGFIMMLVGFFVGAIFSVLKLPVPAPITVSAVLGILGMTLGYLVITHLLKGSM